MSQSTENDDLAEIQELQAAAEVAVLFTGDAVSAAAWYIDFAAFEARLASIRGAAATPLEETFWGTLRDIVQETLAAEQATYRLEDEMVDTLCDLAAQGEEATFRDLAQSVGVPPEDLQALWEGTVARTKKRKVRP